MTSFHHELTVEGRVSDIPALLNFVEACCQAAGVAPHLFFDLQLVVEEAAANIMEHAYLGQGGHFHVAFDMIGRDVQITLRDHGRPFTPRTVHPPDSRRPLAEWPIGGLGLHLMRELMDEVCFSFADGVNTLEMVKRDAILAETQ